MGNRNLKIDLKQLLKSDVVNNLTQHLNGYETKVRKLVEELNLKSLEARTKSKKQLDHFSEQIKKTRSDVERKVLTIVNQEAHRLNRRLTDLVDYLDTVAKKESKSTTTTKKTRSGGSKSKAKRTTRSHSASASQHSLGASTQI